MRMNNKRKEFSYVVSYLGQTMYHEHVTYFDKNKTIEIVAKRKNETEIERIILEKKTRRVIDYIKLQNNIQVMSLILEQNNTYRYNKSSDLFIKSNRPFLLPIMFQCMECFEQSDKGMITENVLVPSNEMTFFPYSYYWFPTKVNIIRPESIFMEYSNDGQLLYMKEFQTQCIKKRI